MTTPNFGALLAKYMNRAGISDSELARTIGVQRQTIFRWKEGIVARPRVREDVLRCASKLRLSREERDQLLLAAGFPPETMPTPSADAEPLSTDPEPTSPNTQAVLTSTVVPTLSRTLPSTLETPTVAPTAPAKGQRQRSWWPGVAAVVAVALVAGWLLWSERFMPSPSNSIAPTLSLGQTALSNPVLTKPTPPPTATSPALDIWPLATPGKMLIVVAPFAGGQDQSVVGTAERIRDELQKEIQTSNLITMSVQIGPRAIQDEVDARQVLTATQATIVIWGGYDSAGVRVQWLVHDATQVEKQNFSFTSPRDLVVTISENVPKEMQIVALYTLGRLFQNNRAFDKAERAYQRALALGPSNDRLTALSNFYLGLLVSRDKNSPQSVKNYDEGIRYYTTAYKLNPLLYNALYNRGTIWLNRALVLTDTTLSTPSFTQAIDDLTSLLEQPTLRKLHQQEPEFARAYFNRGTAYYHRNQPGDQAQAHADLTQAIALNPLLADAWYQRGLVSIRSGHELTWPTDLTQTLTLNPDYYQAYDGFCWGYVLAQQTNAALPYCTEALRNEPRHTQEYSSQDALGLLYAQLGRYAEAIRALEAHRLWVEVYHPQEFKRYRGPEVESWIAALQKKQNPFTPQTLARLR